MNESAGPKAVEKTGEKRPWKSQERFPLSHSFNNNKLDDRDHFLQNAKTSVASLRRLITPTRNADHDQPGTLIIFIGIRKMLGLIALVLIVLWLLGFLAFHISSGLIHILLVIGILMLDFHFLRGSPRTA